VYVVVVVILLQVLLPLWLPGSVQQLQKHLTGYVYVCTEQQVTQLKLRLLVLQRCDGADSRSCVGQEACTWLSAWIRGCPVEIGSGAL
jgi:hypothetical protein